MRKPGAIGLCCIRGKQRDMREDDISFKRCLEKPGRKGQPPCKWFSWISLDARDQWRLKQVDK